MSKPEITRTTDELADKMSFLSATEGQTVLDQSDYDTFNVSAMYDHLGPQYEEYIREDAGRQRVVEWVLSILTEQGIKRGEVVDLGCASGVPVSQMLSANGHDVVGVDLSDGQLKLARERVPDARFVMGDMRKWAPGTNEGLGQLDAVVSFYAFNHLSIVDCKAVFERIHSWLSEEGLFAFGMVEGVNGRTTWFGFEVAAMSMSMEEIQRTLKETGFEVEKSWKEEWTSSTRKDARSKLNQFFCARKRR